MEKIKYDLIPLTGEEIIEAKYNYDSLRSQIFQTENTLKLLDYRIKNDIPNKIFKEQLKEDKKGLLAAKKALKNLDKSDKNYKDKKLKIESDIFAGEMMIKEKEFDLKVGLPTRKLNSIKRQNIENLKRMKMQLKMWKDRVKNKVKKQIRQQVQLNEKVK